MLTATCAIARKDLRLVLGSGAGIMQMLLLGLLLIFVFSLSLDPGQQVAPQTAATIFWLASAFCLVLAGTMCHGLEDASGTRTTLLLAPVPVQAVWLGKALAMGALLGAAQLIFAPAIIVFLGQTPGAMAAMGETGTAGIRLAHVAAGLGGLVLIDLGLVAAGSLLGALARGRGARESLLSILLFPLIVPVLLAGIRLTGAALAPTPPAYAEIADWCGVAAAFAAVFLAAGLLLFGFVYTDED